MSSSFVKDCSDVSAPGNTTSGKTVIIIVNNETGNVSLDGDELQNLLASHGADGSQVSVVRMGSGGVENLSEANINSSIATSDGTQHVNLTVEGYPAIPVEAGQVGGTANYAELPLDADAIRRIESVLESEEAREILGEPLLDMVTNPEQLGTLDELMDSSLFEGDSEDASISGDVSTENSGSQTKVAHSPPKRRSQRQMDKAEREEVEKILAENQKKLQEEKQQLDESQGFARNKNLPDNVPKNKGMGEEVIREGISAEDPKEKSQKYETENDKRVTAAPRGRGKEEKDEEIMVPMRGRGKGRGRGRGRGKIEAGKDSTQESRGRARGKKITDVGKIVIIPSERGQGGGRGRGSQGEDVSSARGRGRGRGRTVKCKDGNINIFKNMESENKKNNSNYVPATGFKMKELKVSVKKMELEQASERKLPALNDEKNAKIIEEEEVRKYSTSSETEDNKSDIVRVVQVVEGPVDSNKKKIKKIPVTPKVLPQFEPALFSTPDVMLKVGEGNSTQAIMVKGNGKSVKTQKIFLVEKQIRKDTGLTSVTVKEEKQKDDANKLKKVVTNTVESSILAIPDKNQRNSSAVVSDGSVSETKANKCVERKKVGSEVKPKVLQVKSPMGVRQVVVLNAAKAGMYRETLVKVIPPKDPPREDEKISPIKQRTLTKKEGQIQKKKMDSQKPENANLVAGVKSDNEKVKETFKGDIHGQGHVQKKTDGVDVQKIGDIQSPEEVVLSKKKEEALRRKEEIQKKREEILRKREAIRKRKELQKKETIQLRREEGIDKKSEQSLEKNEKVVQSIEQEAQRKDGVIQRKKGKEIANNPSKSSHVTSKTKPPAMVSPAEESPVRRSNRAIKKKTFGDEMLTFDIKEDLAPDVEEEQEPEKEMESEGDEDDESLEDYGEDDDPERLWCVCQKPHNNRFMICCDKCEDWFHGSCVGVTKAIGQQMEEEGKEWVCPKCKKAERALKGFLSPSKKVVDSSLCASSENNSLEVEVVEASRQTVTKKVTPGGHKPDIIILEESQKVSKKTLEGGKKVEGQQTRQSVLKRGNMSREIHIPPVKSVEEKMEVSRIPKLPPQKVVDGGKECAVESCTKTPKVDSIYCSNECVLQHAQLSLKMLGKTHKVEEVQNVAEAVTTLEKSEPRVLVYQKSTGKILTGTEAPIIGQLKDWLKEHRDYAVLQPGMMGASGTVLSTSSPLAAPNFYGQKKIIQISPKSVAVPVGGSLGQKVTVVKSADGKIIVKSTETLDKDNINKVVTTVPVPTPTKSVMVSTTKPAVVSTSPVTKEGEGKKEIAVSSKKDESTPTKNTSPKDNKKTQNKPASVEKKKPDPDEVRSNIKKTLADCLLKRFQDAKNEFKNLNEENVKDLAMQIEKELFVFFGKDVGFKYKSRYRSILFNTRDTKNSGLFRKILNGTISPANLVRMTSEELASKELCEWREREEKKELQAIEKYELDMIALGNQYIMKSHKGEIEIDKDEFIKDKEKAPETLNSLPADPLTEILEDTTFGHANHIYDLNCKICTGKQDPSFVRQDSKSHDEKSQEKTKSDKKEDKHREPLKVKSRKERKSSSDRDKKERRTSTDRERHRHKSKDSEKDRKIRDEKNRDRDKDRDNRDKDKSKYKDTNKDGYSSDKDRDKSREKHRGSKDSEREKHKTTKSSSNDKEKKDKERRDSREKRDDQERKHKDKHKDRRDSKDDKDKRRDSEKSKKKRKYSESRYDDRKRRDSEKDFSKRKDTGDDEKQKEEVSTSEDVVFDSYHQGRRFSFHLDSDAKDAEPTSTVVGSPEVMEIKDDTPQYTSPRMPSPTLFPDSLATPPLPPDSPEYIPPPPCDDGSGSLPLPDRPISSIQCDDSDIPTTPPLPDEMPTPPPLPSEDIPCAPPLPDGEIPSTPPLPDDDIPCTPPLPEENFPNTPPLPNEDVPSTPPLPISRSSTTPPLPKENEPTIHPFSSSLLPPPPPPPPLLLSPEFASDSDRLTPPPVGVQKSSVTSVSLPTVISAEPLNVWKGIIHMPDVAKFHASAFEVSGKAKFLPDDVPNSIEVVGRIAPETVWSYIAQMKKSGSKEILVVRFQPANEEEKVSYIALYSYLSSKKRYAVIGNCEKSVKDFYVVPLASHQPIPQVLLPLDGPGFEEHRAHMLIGVIVRAKSKRVFDHITGTWSVVSFGPVLPVQPVHKPPDIPERSYTPPLPTDEDIQEIALAAKESEDDEVDVNEGSTAEKNLGEESSLEIFESGPLKRQATDSGEATQPKKRLISLVSDSSVATSTFLNEEPNSPPEESFVEASLDQESMLAELNRQIEEHKKELSEMQKTIGNEEEEPYSPSRGHSPPPSGREQLKLDTSKISIPSNLQEILDNIKQKEVEIKQKEQEIKRRLSLTSDPIVMNYGKCQEFENKKIGVSTASAVKADIDLRPLLQTKSNKDHKTDVDLRILKNADDKEKPENKVDMAAKTDEDTDLRVRDPRLARTQAAAASEKGKTLSKMSDEELLAKVSEMENNDKISRPPHPETGVESLYQPPPPSFMQPGLTSGYLPQGGPVVLPDGMTCPVGPSQPPGHMTYIGAMGPPQPMDMYGPQGGRLQGPARHAVPQEHSDTPGHSSARGPLGHSVPCGPPGYSGPQGHSGSHGPSSYSGPHVPMRPRYSDSGWEGGKSYNSRDWGHHYNKPRDRDQDRDRDWDWERDWQPRVGRDKGRSKFHHMGRKRYDGRVGGYERSRDNFYYDRRDRDHAYEEHELGRDSPYPEIDY